MTDSASNPHPSRMTRWAVVMTILLALYQAVAGIHAVQMATDQNVITSLVLPLEVISALSWTLIFSAVALALVRKRPHALRYSLWAIVGFGLYSIIRLLIFARADYDRNRLFFLLIAAAGIIGVPAVFQILRHRWINKQASEKENYGP